MLHCQFQFRHKLGCRPWSARSISSTWHKSAFSSFVPSDAQRKTIFALSTPPGKAGIAVVRVSGPDALLVWKNMVRPQRKNFVVPKPWKMERCHIIQPNSGHEKLDDGLAVYFQGPNSFTTEDVVELHLHSGRAIISSVLGVLSQFSFCRPAEAGEFTRRAFQGGRLDLTQVEGLQDLVDADTECQRRMAIRNAGGVAKAQFDELRSDIIGCLANVEALIDFGEGEDFEDGLYGQVRTRAQQILARIQRLLEDNRRGEIIRSGIRLAIFGPPNAGKSSLLNFLAHREAAIVTPIPGTTRDILELTLDIGGLPIIVLDTAGLRITGDLIEHMGVERAKQAIETSDLSLCVLSLPEVMVETAAGPRIEVPHLLKPLINPDTIYLFNKTDLVPGNISAAFTSDVYPFWKASITTGEGTAPFLTGLAEVIQARFGQDSQVMSKEPPLITRARHRVHLESASRFLEAFLLTSPADIVLGAEELRYAARAIGKISGIIDVEDILDAVFKDFCIGK